MYFRWNRYGGYFMTIDTHGSLIVFVFSMQTQLPRLGKRELICLPLFTCNYVISIWRGFLCLWVLGMGYVILLWHSLSLPYNYFVVGSHLNITHTYTHTHTRTRTHARTQKKFVRITYTLVILDALDKVPRSWVILAKNSMDKKLFAI